MLAAAPSARADDPLSQEQAEALRTRKTVASTIQGIGIPCIALGLIHRELKVEPGKVSLIPDLKDAEGGIIAVYLANATDQVIEGADSNHAHCFLEVKDGNRWRSCDRFSPGCGTGTPAPQDLPAKHATIFLGTNPNLGDMTGEMRFCITLPHARPVVSASFQGRFSSKRFEEATPHTRPVTESIVNGLAGKDQNDANNELRLRIARSPEEYIAAGELERCHDESGPTKAALIRWQATALAGDDMAQCRTALTSLLERPWTHQLDAPALFERCFTALTHDGGKMEFGSPERCRAMTWRYLSAFRSEWLEVFINPERWDQLETIRHSGNPWGVDQKRVAILVEEAVASLRSPDPGEREAAGTFLNGYWITEKHLPDERCWFVLDHDVASARKGAIAALARRGNHRQVGKWLVDHRDLAGLNLAALWEAAREDRKQFADWELPVALKLLETSPLDTARTLAVRSALIKEAGGRPLPIELLPPLRRFLEEEAKAKRLIGLPPPEPGESGTNGPRACDPRGREPERLRSALYALAAWEDPADTALLKSYLTHPAALYSTSDQRVTRHYDIRSVAAHLLKERNEKVPDGIVFEEPVN